MQITEGGCLCQSIRYRILGQPESSIICHCGTCRRANAAASVAWVTAAVSQFQFLCGSAQVYHSSKDVVRRFCGLCGSPLTYENAAYPATIDVTTATLNNPDAFPPSMEVWLEHKIAWQAPNPYLTHHERGNAGASAGRES